MGCDECDAQLLEAAATIETLRARVALLEKVQDEAETVCCQMGKLTSLLHEYPGLVNRLKALHAALSALQEAGK